MDITTATAIMTANKGYLVTVLLNDDTRHDGLAISVNSKGININVDGKTRSFGLTRVADIIVADDMADDDDNDTYGADDLADDLAAVDIAMDADDDDETYGADDDADDRAAAAAGDDEEYEDGMSTADVAAIVGMTPKELRVILRRLGMGVGRGRQYGLDGSVVRAVREDMARTAAAATNA